MRRSGADGTGQDETRRKESGQVGTRRDETGWYGAGRPRHVPCHPLASLPSSPVIFPFRPVLYCTVQLCHVPPDRLCPFQLTPVPFVGQLLYKPHKSKHLRWYFTGCRKKFVFINPNSINLLQTLRPCCTLSHRAAHSPTILHDKIFSSSLAAHSHLLLLHTLPGCCTLF